MVGVVRVVCGVRIGVAVGCVGTRGEGAVSSGRSVCVAEGSVWWRNWMEGLLQILRLDFRRAPGRPLIPSPIHAEYRSKSVKKY